MAWCTTHIIKGLDFFCNSKVIGNDFLFPLNNVLNIHVYIFCDPFCSQFVTRPGLDRKRKGYCKKTEVNKRQLFFRDTDVIAWASSFLSLPFPLSVRSMVSPASCDLRLYSSAGSGKGNMETWVQQQSLGLCNN